MKYCESILAAGPPMPPAVMCPKCLKKYRSENHVCQPSALAKLKPVIEAQRRAQQTKR